MSDELERQLVEVLAMNQAIVKQSQAIAQQAAASVMLVSEQVCKAITSLVNEINQSSHRNTVATSQLVNAVRWKPEAEPGFNVSAICRGYGVQWDEWAAEHQAQLSLLVAEGEKLEQHGFDWFATYKLAWHLQMNIDGALSFRLLNAAMKSPSGEQLEAQINDKLAELGLGSPSSNDMPDNWFEGEAT